MEQKSISLQSEAGFRVLFECATISILVVGRTGEIELSNPCANALFGYAASELIGKPVETLIPESLRAQHSQHRQKYFSKPKDRPMGLGLELFARKKSGEVFPVEISLGHYELNGDRLAVAFVTDISDHVKAKQLLEQREAWFRNMADHCPVMIWVSGTDKRCSYFNNTWLSFTGRSMEQEVGDGWVAGVHPDDVQQCLKTYSHAFDHRRPFSMEYRLQRHDQQYRWIRDIGQPTYIDDEFHGYIGSCTDIHDERMMQEELERLVDLRTAELSAALGREKEINELKSRFVSMAAHEFRTPLSVVLSSTALIQRYEPNPSVQKHIARIKSSVATLTEILNDFLSLDKLEKGTVELETELFNLGDFIDNIVEEVLTTKKRGQEVFAANRGDAFVQLDMKKLRYILVNLLSNAVKYSPEEANISVNSQVTHEHVTLSVQDNGIGIPEEEQKFMFRKFFRAKNTGSIQGTGLGLTIVKRYVDLMGGSISFSSARGVGTTFKVILPIFKMM